MGGNIASVTPSINRREVSNEIEKAAQAGSNHLVLPRCSSCLFPREQGVTGIKPHCPPGFVDRAYLVFCVETAIHYGPNCCSRDRLRSVHPLSVFRTTRLHQGTSPFFVTADCDFNLFGNDPGRL